MNVEFFRGLRPQAEGPARRDAPARELPPPETLLVPMPGARHAAFRAVKEGDAVAQYQPLSQPQTAAPACSPAAGTVEEFRTVDHPLLGPVLCAVLRVKPGGPAPARPPLLARTPEALETAARNAGILDECSGEPLYRLLKTFRRFGVPALCAWAAGEEPFPGGTEAAFLSAPAETASGLRLAADSCGAQECCVAVRDRRLLRVPWTEGAGLPELREVGARVPAWAFFEQRFRARGLRVGRVGAQACAALYRAVERGVPQVETVVTVAGEGVERPGHFRVPAGYPLRALLEASGLKEGAHVVLGSPFTGAAAPDETIPVCLGMHTVLALPHARERRPFACVGCGRCAAVCPERLFPYRYAEHRENGAPLSHAELAAAARCGGCRCCEAVCPAGLALEEAVRLVTEGGTP